MMKRLIHAAIFPCFLFLADAQPTAAEVEEMLNIGVPEETEPQHVEPALPRVLLIGDSIAGGYLGGVRGELRGIAHVERGNSGGTTQNGLEQIERILGEGGWDIIHFNWGLHDMTWQRRMSPEERGIDAYAARLGQLVDRLRQTGAKLVWATTTPWPEHNYAYFEERFGERLVYSREQEKEWSDAALAVIRKHDIPVNDLHSILLPGLEIYQKTDDVHFTREGNAAMARQIASVIKPMLSSTEE